MIFDQLFQKRASLENPSTNLSDPAAWLAHAFGAAPSSTGVLVSEKNATQIVAFWSAVNTIADTLAALPIKLIRSKSDGSTENIHVHPALRVMRNPNPMMVPITLRSTLQAHSLTWGNSYAYIVRNALGNPVELWPLDPAKTKSRITNRELWFDTQLDIGNTAIPAEDVLHIPALTRNGVDGMSIVAEQREMLGSAIAQQAFAGKFFANGAKPSGLLSYPGKVRDPQKIKQALQEATGGENAHSMMVLDNDAKFTPFSIPPEDAQFLQTREFSIDEIGRMFRLPLHFLNKMGQATFNNVEMMGTHFVQYTMMPWIIRDEQEKTRKLLKPGEIDRGMRFKYNIAALVRGDIKTRSEVYAKGVQFGWVTRNEVRALEDMNPLDGLDEPLVPLNLGAVGEQEPESDPPDDEPAGEAEDETEDETEDEGGDEDRAYMVLLSAATRLANKEANAIRRLAKRKGWMQRTEVESFYERHQRHMVENLAITPLHASQYARNQVVRLYGPGNIEEKLAAIVSEDAVNLVNEIVEDRNDES